MRTTPIRAFCLALPLAFASTVRAQSFDVGLAEFDDEDYEDAALTFYDVASRDPDANVRNEALVYLAFTLERMGLWAPASFYYQVILEDGPSNRRWTNALEQLLEVQEKYRDHIFVDTLIDRNFDGRAFGRALKGNRIDQVNYRLGALYLLQGKASRAQQFLEFVRPESRYYAQGQYLLGITSLSQGKPEAAASHFHTVAENISPQTEDTDLRRVRELALLAKARAAYGVGRYGDAINGFGAIPRYSEFWFQSLYEQAWAHYQQQNYGEALGVLESVLSPYFAKRHVPEAYVIQGTSYFTYCQWDRVRRSVERYKKIYEPMKRELDAYLAATQDTSTYLNDVIDGGGGRYAEEIAREVRRVGWFKDLYFMLRHLEWQNARLGEIEEWRGSRFLQDIRQMVDDKLRNARNFTGGWVRVRLQFHADNMKNFQNQIDILDFELTDAERKWLEGGREILKGRRARLPRPDIPTDQWQHWSIAKEYWKDELGYYQHTLQSECN